MTKDRAKKLNDMSLVRNGTELAEWLRIGKDEVSRLKKQGVLPHGHDGYPLMECVWAYHDFKLRSRKAIQESTQIDIERDTAEKVHWQKENEKQKNLAWRAQYAQEVAEKVVSALAAYFDQCRDAVAKYPEACAILRTLASKCRSVDLDAIVMGQAEKTDEDDTDE